MDPLEHSVEYMRRLLNNAEAEINRLTIENWQLKGALGYPVPGHIPESTEFKCGLCDARRNDINEQEIKPRRGTLDEVPTPGGPKP